MVLFEWTKKKTTAAFNYRFNNCLIKYDDTTTNLDYQFTTDAAHYSAIMNQNPKFFSNLNRLNIDETSGFTKGNSTYLIPLDILGNTRYTPDLGAYQNKSFL
jgi:hypothetical protein